MVSAVIAHRCNTPQGLRDVEAAPDVIGAEVDLFCGPVVTGLFCGHLTKWDQATRALAQHAEAPFLVPLEDILYDHPFLEFVLDLKGKNPIGHAANLKGYHQALVQRSAPSYIFPGSNEELYETLGGPDGDLRLIWVTDNFAKVPPISPERAKIVPFDLNSLYMSANVFLRCSVLARQTSHLKLGKIAPDNIDAVCASIERIKTEKQPSQIERVSFSTDYPKEIARALLRHSHVFDEHLSRGNVPQTYLAA